ncbi:glycoside hydrolase family 3 C-terminal domain-containing protein [Aquabacterium sp. A7-Y]|uniref:beta-glucosidase family protein n=1 Tax=Aquabacterium sp. A7-Y TaxID=1349605 RepID=UPI00223CBD15|nr:glycoside hydrolase family 3 C-terminal domain-containing protein [Aquabacterium sp. A7-Y]MCW7539919.1 glycoside hydrolase family 3 C-terminal domain-containing protein [Aquabacterium sp. A7-Y]
MLLAALLAGCTSGGPPPDPSERRARELLTQLSLDEKIQLVHGVGEVPEGAGLIPGIPRLGIPDLRYVDSASGINLAGSGATPLPAPIALAATWDADLAEAYGRLIGQELRALGIAVGLGTGINLAREPRNGRTFEYMGEDPVLAGVLAARRTAATQQEQVVATIKHLGFNHQETRRFSSNSVVDERTMRELELLAFEIAVKEGRPGNVMCAYNLVNGLKSCESPYLIETVLKQDWGYPGVVQSDWVLAVTDTERAALAGLDEEQPGSLNDFVGSYGVQTFFNQRLKAAVQDGRVPADRLDDMVLRKLRTLYRIGLMDRPPGPRQPIDREAGHRLAHQIATEAMVLLKNDAPAAGSTPLLPLQPAALRSVLVVGAHADAGVISGGGSARVPPPDGIDPVPCTEPERQPGPEALFRACATYYPSAPLHALRERLPQAQLRYLDGRNAAAAAEAAAAADLAIVFASQWTSEQVDLASLALPGPTTDPTNHPYDQEALIRAVAARNPRTVLVLQTGTALTMPWLDAVPAVLQAWYPGVKGGEAIADVLLGAVNPSGKLPLTFPRGESDLPQPVISSTELDVVYREGLAMGYRWFDSRGLTPLFPFGHGLSYTQFAYSGLSAAAYGRGGVELRFTLANTGAREGAEVAQVYASLPASAGEPPQRLVGWQKVKLAAGERREVVIRIPRERLAIWDTGAHRWRVPSGSYTLRVGGSSRDAGAQSTTVRR